MTDLLNAEFEDETGTVRRLHRDELLLYPDGDRHRRRGDHDPADRLGRKDIGRTPRSASRAGRESGLIPQAIEEILRWEPPALQIARYVARDVEYYGQTVPGGCGDADARRCGQP